MKVIIFIFVVLILMYILSIAIAMEWNGIYRNDPRAKLVAGTGKIHYKGLGSNKESIETLLNRIYWVADADGRNTKWKRCFMIAFISTIAIIYIVYTRPPTAKEVILLILIVFIACMACSSFFRFHSDRFAPYYIRQNILLLQKKLNLQTYSDPGPPLKSVKPPKYNVLDTLLKKG